MVSALVEDCALSQVDRSTNSRLNKFFIWRKVRVICRKKNLSSRMKRYKR
jgi:hypothetical protein